MMRTLKTLALAASLAVPTFAFAQPVMNADPDAKPEPAPPPEVPAEAKEAQEVLTTYLDAVKAKKWNDARKLTHPKTMAAIAQRKKNLGHEDHPMAPWFYEKSQYWLKDWRLTGVNPAFGGTWIFSTSEDNFQVEEKGLSEGDEAHYLVGRTGGKWMVVDKKRGVTFGKDSIRYGYKGWFDEPPAKAEGQ